MNPSLKQVTEEMNALRLLLDHLDDLATFAAAAQPGNTVIFAVGSEWKVSARETADANEWLDDCVYQTHVAAQASKNSIHDLLYRDLMKYIDSLIEYKRSQL